MLKKESKTDKISGFVGNMRLPIHRWFRYSAGFPAEWIKEVVRNFKGKKSITLFDPFVGSGTTVLAGEECGVQSCGIEAHPFIVRVAKAKLLWDEDTTTFEKFAMNVLARANRIKKAAKFYPKLIHKCYSENFLNELDKLRRSWLHFNDDSAISELTWLALVCILRTSSIAGTAPWQYILPKKTKKKPTRPFVAFSKQVKMMIQDMQYFQSTVKVPRGVIYEDDARQCSKIKDSSVNLVITSPPYTNNYDYADATRLEMSFFGEIEGWGDLQTKVRDQLIRSCSQHMSDKDRLDEILDEKKLDPIIDELSKVCNDLSKERLKHGGRKNYHLMVAAYFSDLAKVWIALRRVCSKKSKICFVLGDSAPYGIYVPVDRWLGELAMSAHFKSYYFEKTRDRNVKWKSNRKHKVRLHEGRLWVEG